MHIATELTADWTEGVLQPFTAHRSTTVSCLAVVSCFLFSSCEPSCVWAILEERRAVQLVARDTKCGNECCHNYSSNIQNIQVDYSEISNRPQEKCVQKAKRQ